MDYVYEEPAVSGNWVNLRLDKITYPNGRDVFYNYSTSGNTAVGNRVDNIAADGSGTADFAQYKYLGGGMMLQRRHPVPEVGFNGRMRLTRLKTDGNDPYAALDRFGRVVDQRWRDDANDYDRFTYDYDRNSNRLYRKNEVDGDFSELYHANSASSNTEYDGLNRLKEFRRGTLSAQHDAIGTGSTTRRQLFTLDQVGNWPGFKDDGGPGDEDGTWDLDQARKHNKANEIDDPTYGSAITETGRSWVDPDHDRAGNAVKLPRPSSPNHQPTAPAVSEEQRLHLTYDAWNRLVKVQDDDEGDPGVTIVEYRYDGLNRRIVKLIPNGDNWDRTDYYYTDSWQVIEERIAISQEAEEDVVANAKYQWVWGLEYVDAAVCRDEDTNSDGNCVDAEGSERLYYCYDANFNVTALIETDGDVAERYLYDAYGRPRICNADWSNTAVTWANSKKNEVLFAGYRYDPETGLYHVRLRPYHPTLGRWTARDPVEYDGLMHLYAYVCNDPVGELDPSGTGGTSDKKMPEKMPLSKSDKVLLARYIQEELQDEGQLAPAKREDASLKERACYSTGKRLKMKVATKGFLNLVVSLIKAPIDAVRLLYGEGVIKKLLKKVKKKGLDEAARKLLKKRAADLQLIEMKTDTGPNGCHGEVQILYDIKTRRLAGTLTGAVRCVVTSSGVCEKRGKLESFGYRLSGKVKWERYGWWIFGGIRMAGINLSVGE